MSTLEKNLYKRVTVTSGPQQATSGRAYRGFSSINENSEGYALYDFELIKQDIINHFHIRQGEKLSDPQFGCIIWDLLFEPFTNNIRDAIIQNVTDIVNYDPRVNVEQIIVDTYESGITVDCTISYLPYNISEQLLFRFDQAAGIK
jgi:phage baseplate assembly protein W